MIRNEYGRFLPIYYNIVVWNIHSFFMLNEFGKGVKMMIKTLTILFGVMTLAIGVLGFIPSLTPNNMLLGIFQVDTLHNIIHVLTGAGALIAAMAGASYAKTFFKLFAVVYALVTVMGFVTGYGLAVLLPVNMADNLLHVAITVYSAYVGFVMNEDHSTAHA